MLNLYDRGIIVAFFCLLAAAGWVFRRFSSDSSDFFRGGGSVPWWFVGTSAFMGAFSAWTFTGAASLAYRHGAAVMAIYAANAFALICNALWFSPRFRQMRVIVMMEGVRMRLGTGNELFFTLITVVTQILGAAIWLYSLAVFSVPIIGISLPAMIIASGLTVTFIATLGGSWGVIASDFLQTLMLFPITIILAIYSIHETHGLKSIIAAGIHAATSAPSAPGESHYGIAWTAALCAVAFFGFNSLYNCSRALCARTGKEARKASLLSAGLFLGGTCVWFIPPIAARIVGLDLTRLYPQMRIPEEAAYVAMAQRYLPTGLLGLMVTGIISSTMSSMDGALNRNAGVIVRSLYQPFFRPAATESEMVAVGRLATAACGGGIVLIALLYSAWPQLELLDLMFNFTALVTTPIVVALFWCVIFRRAVDWAAWSTVLVGLTVGGIIQLSNLWTPVLPKTLAGSAAFLRTEHYVATAFASIAACSLWYFAASAWGKSTNDSNRRRDVAEFFARLGRPISSAEIAHTGHSAGSLKLIGLLALIYGVGIAALAVIPNPFYGRLAIAACGAAVALVGIVLRRLARP